MTATLAVTGCAPKAAEAPKSTEPTATVGSRMAGPVVDVNVSPQAMATKPEPAKLSTPEEAVRSYLDWTSFAYRTAQSAVAKPTMSGNEEVRVDSYVQLNLQKSRLIDQKLDSIEFGTARVTGDKATITAREEWTYRYVSIAVADKTLAGPYKAAYDTTYSLVKTASGWVVDSVQAKAKGEVK